jgi:hypothetical protein
MVTPEIADNQDNHEGRDECIKGNQKEVVQPVPSQFHFIKTLIGKVQYLDEYQQGNDQKILGIMGDTFVCTKKIGIEPNPEGQVESDQDGDDITKNIELKQLFPPFFYHCFPRT